MICHHILNCGIFGRFWRSRVQITADPECACGEPMEVDNRYVGVSVLHRVPPIARPCVQFVVGRNVIRTLRQQAADRRCLRERVVKKCRGADRGSAQSGSWQPSSETHQFEHRQPSRRAKGPVKANPGR